MKKIIIGGLVTGLILFIWQFLSYGLLDLHGSQMTYTPNQDAILEALNANLTEEGEYFIGRAPMDASREVQEAEMAKREGQPWALVSYHTAMSNNMGMNMIRGFAIDFLAGIIICWILMKVKLLDMMTAIKLSIGVGIIGYLTINYLDAVWFEGNTIPDLIDAIIPWALIGAWTGWYLPKE